MMLWLDSELALATVDVLGAYKSVCKTASNMLAPITWFWSNICGKFAKNALNTEDDLEISRDISDQWNLLNFFPHFNIIYDNNVP